VHVREVFFKFKLLRELSFHFLAGNFALHVARMIRIPSKVNIGIGLKMDDKVSFKLRFNTSVEDNLDTVICLRNVSNPNLTANRRELTLTTLAITQTTESNLACAGRNSAHADCTDPLLLLL